ncbi:MAG: superoxide dismutase [Gemmatimonadota bacterium]|nr:superoxide dismutase [Gemmatimonadota bacterium]
MQKYELPDLPYDYDALEPHIDEQTMRLHHSKHHQGYVNGANTALESLARARETNDLAAVKPLSRDLAFNVSGHVLHSVFWRNMTPNEDERTRPDWLTGLLADQFGSFDAFRSHFTAAAKGVEGSGWGILAWEGMADRLLVLQTEKHQNITVQGLDPLLVIDMWEHAYYLKHQNDRAAYLDSFWKVVNWSDVAERTERARAADLVATG